ncbi:MAG: DUF4417 domain-containing protein [Alphaproteobacteria bacterium]|nr:DUF4417 domain-containing protein [Alphaproteobacteria bacterium]
MLSVPGTTKEPQRDRNHRREKRRWHDGKKHMPSLGCSACPNLGTCGGLQVERALYHCLDNCCGHPATCDVVCRNKPREFAQRVREIGGFELGNVPRAARLPAPCLPAVVPVLFHGSSRLAPFQASAVCLPIYKVIARHGGQERFADGAAVAAAFRFEAGTPLILTGTAKDQPLERWWSLGPGRLDAIRRLRDLGVELVTTPNFSLFTDQPRWDDMHSIKRIALTHEEFLREGMPAALHVNARTERDWERWTEYVRQRNEVTHVAFEFATGAGWAGRVGWQLTQLTNLARGAGRPLHLVARAVGSDTLPGLITAFAATTVLETTCFVKAIKRRRAVISDTGNIAWECAPTAPSEPVDDLLAHNWSVVRQSYEPAFGEGSLMQAAE